MNNVLPVMETVFGSHLYHLNTPASDRDYKGIYLPHPRDIILGTAKDSIDLSTGNKSSKNTVDDVDRQFFSLRKFINLALVGDTVAIDMLHGGTDKLTRDSDIWQYIRQNRHRFYTSQLTGLFGYVRKQASKYGVKGSRLAALRQVVDVLKDVRKQAMDMDSQNDTENKLYPQMKVGHIADRFPENEFLRFVEMDLPEKGGAQRFYEVLGRRYQMTIRVSEMEKSVMKLWEEYGDRARQAEANNGIDWKALSHALRGGYQLIQIYEEGGFEYPLRHSEMLRKTKAGELSFSEVQEELEHVMDRVERAAASTSYPAEPDKEFWESFVEKVYSDHVLAYYNR